jgi:hypothetical protein
MKQSTLLGAVALCLFWAGAAPNALAQQADADGTITTTTVTNVAGTITQLNYGNGGEVQGFLIGTKILLSFPTNICGGVSTLGVVGNSVTYSGAAVTATSGFQSVRISSFTNNTTKATYTAPTSTSTSTAYGPTSGTVKQLNYSDDGSIDGFLFTASGSTIFVSTGDRGSTTLTTLLTAGATVSVTGTTSANMSACSSTGAIQSVDASSLTIGTTTVVISGGGRGGHGGGPH